MSFMLANLYFLRRDYQRAVPLLEVVVRSDPAHSTARKRLIIGYIQLDRIGDALGEFLIALRTDPRSIIDTDLEGEDCPCPDHCAALEKRLPHAPDRFPLLTGLGILSLYCDLPRSKHYLGQALALRPEERVLSSALELIAKESPACRP